tara:strand:- start:41 stop:358 length:318 start_codon:yes stop_codon:yes gene_type:complete
MENSKTYNGWSNYETWNVKLWIDNEEGTQRHFQERAETLRESVSTFQYWSQEESAKFNLAEEIKDFVNEHKPVEDASMYTDLLNAAISEVDFDEIAESILSEVTV